MGARTRSASRTEARRRNRLNPERLLPAHTLEKRMTSESLKKKAYDLAVSIGLEIYTWPFDGEKSKSHWRYGQRSSADQYAKTFDSAEDAAVHFLTTREAQNALKRREADDLTIMAQCASALVIE